MNKKGLTLTAVFEAESANYGEGIGNITTLKKMSRADGNMYTYISRQALRYSIVQQMDADNTPVVFNGTIQFSPTASIRDYPEIDLFGYMKTKGKSGDDAGGADTRSAVARLSNAISLEPYNSDLDFLTNMGLAKRGGADGNALPNNIAQSEIHRSLYSYTVTVDLDRVGVDVGIEIPMEERCRRVCSLLDTLQFLYRDIKGRRENLAPVFAVGGVYSRKTPYFEGRVRLQNGRLNIAAVRELIGSCEDTAENTVVGAIPEYEADCSGLAGGSVSSMFGSLKKAVKEYYDVV